MGQGVEAGLVAVGQNSRCIAARFSVAGRIWAFSVSQSLSQRVNQYIEGQEEHHRRFDFQTEFRKLLDAHGMAYDERYVWD